MCGFEWVENMDTNSFEKLTLLIPWTWEDCKNFLKSFLLSKIIIYNHGK